MTSTADFLPMLPARIRAKFVIDESGCWIWTAAKTQLGYGMAKWDGKGQPAHRVVYTLIVGRIPEGLVLDHTCNTRACVNPEHLTATTHSANCARRVRRNSPPVSFRGRERPPHNDRFGAPGRYGSYALGCRCVECLQAQRDYRQAYNSRPRMGVA